MKSLLNKRLPGILAVGLVTLAVGAAGVTSTATAATTHDASVSSLTKKQKKAKAKAIKKCKRIKKSSKRKACIKKVKKKYKKLAAPKGKTTTVYLRDDSSYNRFDPTQVDIKVNDLVKWSWQYVGGFEPHNATLSQGPSGIIRSSFSSETTAGTGYTFTREFTKPGDYRFVCTLHIGMEMDVKVSK